MTKLLERESLRRWLAGSRSMMRSEGQHSMVSGWLALPGGASFAGFPGLRVAMQRSFLWVWSDSERGFFDEVQRRILRKSWWVLRELLVVWRVCKHTRWTMERSARAKVTAKARHKAGKKQGKKQLIAACHWVISVSIWPVLPSATANQILSWAGPTPRSPVLACN